MPTLVQLSDLHLNSDGTEIKGVDTRKTLERVLEAVEQDVPEADRLVLTGDIAHDEIAPTYELLREVLGPRASKTLVVPGNHDNPEALAQAFPEPSTCRAFTTFSASIEGWRLLGLDSHVPTKVWGRLEETQLDWARRELEEAPEPNVVLFLHHPPAPYGNDWPEDFGLVDATDLEAIVASDDRVQAIFHGHIHQERQSQLGGRSVYAVPSTCFQFETDGWPAGVDESARPGYRVIELEQDVSTRVVRV